MPTTSRHSARTNLPELVKVLSRPIAVGHYMQGVPLAILIVRYQCVSEHSYHYRYFGYTTDDVVAAVQFDPSLLWLPDKAQPAALAFAFANDTSDTSRRHYLAQVAGLMTPEMLVQQNIRPPLNHRHDLLYSFEYFKTCDLLPPALLRKATMLRMTQTEAGPALVTSMKLHEETDANPIPAGITPKMSRGRRRGKPSHQRQAMVKKLVDSLLAKSDKPAV